MQIQKNATHLEHMSDLDLRLGNYNLLFVVYRLWLHFASDEFCLAHFTAAFTFSSSTYNDYLFNRWNGRTYARRCR